MPAVLYPKMSYHSVSQGDLDVLAMLTSDSSNLGPLPPSSVSNSSSPSSSKHTETQTRKKALPRREAPMDALLLSAVLSGSGPLTRHHIGHGAARAGAYSSCDESRPTSPSRAPSVPKVTMRSMQAPRSQRVKEEERTQKETAAPIPISARKDSPQSPVHTAHSLSSSVGKDKPRRRMSIDPAPVSQILQSASPSANFYAKSTPSATTQPPNTKCQVRCMARTRIPTPHGEMFLHLYHNNLDLKEHLAIVYDPVQLSPEVRSSAPRGRLEIRSTSLDASWREGETDMERVVRGAYVGRLLPGGEDQASAPGKSSRTIPEENTFDGLEEEEEDVLPLVRIHSECYTGETIGSMRCDCGEQLDEAMRRIALPQTLPSGSRQVPGRGVVIYLRQEGRGIGLLEKIRAYNLQDLGHDTVTANLMLGHGADERRYNVAAEILHDLGLGEKGIRLLTNNPEKVEGLAAEGIRVSERVGMVPRDWAEAGTDSEQDYVDWRTRRAGVGLIGAGPASGPELEKYLRTKVERMGHMIDLPHGLTHLI